MAHPRIDHAGEPEEVIELQDSIGPRPWRLLVLPPSPSEETIHTLATELVSTVRAQVHEVVVDLNAVEAPTDGLATTLHRGAEVLSWAGGTLVVDGASGELRRSLEALGENPSLVLNAA